MKVDTLKGEMWKNRVDLFIKFRYDYSCIWPQTPSIDLWLLQTRSDRSCPRSPDFYFVCLELHLKYSDNIFKSCQFEPFYEKQKVRKFLKVASIWIFRQFLNSSISRDRFILNFFENFEIPRIATNEIRKCGFDL